MSYLVQVQQYNKTTFRTNRNRDATMAVIGLNTPGLSLGNLFMIASLSVSQPPPG